MINIPNEKPGLSLIVSFPKTNSYLFFNFNEKINDKTI